MAELFEELAGLDKLIHEPARLAIMTALSACRRVDFLYLQRLIGLTNGNLSSHLARLASAGLVQIDKQFQENRPNTRVALTEKGRAAIEQYWSQLEELRDAARHWEPDEDEG